MGTSGTAITTAEVPAVDTTLKRRARRVASLFAVLMSILAAVLYVVRAKKVMALVALPDELEQFVVGRMILHGHHLYRDVFSHHGPLPYLIAHAYAALINESDFRYIRISQIILALFSCAALVFSPILKTTCGRLWAGGCYLLLLALTWDLVLFSPFMYYGMSCFLLVPLVTQCALPAAFDEMPSSSWLFASGAAAALACFSAYSNGPAVVLFIAPVLLKLTVRPTRRIRLARARPFAVALASTIFAVGAWLLTYGDLRGYYIYHLYFNQAVYGKDFNLISIFDNFTFSFDSAAIIQSLSLALFLCSIYNLALLRRTSGPRKEVVLRALALSVTACGVLFTNPTGQSGNPSFVSLSFALFSLGSASLLEERLLSQCIRGIVNAVFLCGAALIVTNRVSEYAKSYLDIPRKEMSGYVEEPHPRTDAMYGFIRRITRMDGDLLALNYNAGIYYRADRIPASGNVFYLPWQAEYNAHPKYGYKLDVCEDIKSNRPAVIWFFNLQVGDGPSIDDYEPCVLARIVENYTPLTFGSPWHVRNDLYASAVVSLPVGADVTDLGYGPFVPKVLRPSVRLSSFAPIQFRMPPMHLAQKALLRRVGVLIGTHGNQDTGEAELYLDGPNGMPISRSFALSALADNSYHFFDVDPGLYTKGGIRSVMGGGISVWESSWELGWKHSYTCMIYEYTDGSRRYTPECPVK